MRAPQHVIAVAVFGLALCPGATAFDNTQFCQALTQLVRASAGDVGTWVDRTTRNDGVELSCSRKLVHFKRTSTARSSALSSEWREAKTEEWRSAYCAKPMWREAVDNGWVISSMLTTAGGQHVWFACQKGGGAFHRVVP